MSDERVSRLTKTLHDVAYLWAKAETYGMDDPLISIRGIEANDEAMRCDTIEVTVFSGPHLSGKEKYIVSVKEAGYAN